jgi:hypothetical protein
LALRLIRVSFWMRITVTWPLGDVWPPALGTFTPPSAVIAWNRWRSTKFTTR